MSESKKRLDVAVHECGLAQSRQRARSLIMAGKVLVNENIFDKPGVMVSRTDILSLKEPDMPFVSRGGIKLEAAFKEFNIDVNELICLDVGASTGGFTDCLLKHGAKKVFAVDVGYGQLAWVLRQDDRVITIERTNIRYMLPETLGCLVDFVTIDVSFISLKTVVPVVIKFLKSTACIIALIKPQFEVGKGKVGKGGVVKDTLLHTEVVNSLSDFFSKTGLDIEGVIPSPIFGPKGNKEFLVYMKYQRNN
ncbi:MAG: TlyA family RNA methyltransferase [Desulfobacterium sp.]|nr:TlyA family RNA methyltransferase [Desulfobacterium sp.]MBU3948249.1 TlyA family RNA methyltransferase [Pseudomonadota bacterium]